MNREYIIDQEMTKSREEMIRIEYGNLLSKEKGEADDDRSFVNNQQRSNWAHGALPLSAELAGQYFPGHETLSPSPSSFSPSSSLSSPSSLSATPSL